MKLKKVIIISAIIGGITAAVIGCGSGSANGSSGPVTIQNQNGYYNVTIDLTNASHREVGRQYALAIRSAMPDYETTLKQSLKTSYSFIAMDKDHPVRWQDLIDRANALFANLDPDYQDEILGMQEIFNYPYSDQNGTMLSKDEFLFYLLGADVMRTVACSASGVFGAATLTGNSAIGRNADAITAGKTTFGKMQALTTFKNGNKTISTIGTLGFLGAMSVFNQNKMFGAILDSTTGATYPSDLSSYRSYVFDLRNAFERLSDIDSIETYMGCRNNTDPSCKKYAYNHNIFLADQSRVGIIENQSNPSANNPGNRTIRWSSSILSTEDVSQTFQDWKYDNVHRIDWAVATVNDYRLVGNVFTNTSDNVKRWRSYKDCFLKSQGKVNGGMCSITLPNKIGPTEMKQVMGYLGPMNNGSQDDGAIFIAEVIADFPNPSNPPNASFSMHGPTHPAYATMQSIVMDMGTMDLWVYFADPSSTRVTVPNYIKITNPIYQ